MQISLVQKSPHQIEVGRGFHLVKTETESVLQAVDYIAQCYRVPDEIVFAEGEVISYVLPLQIPSSFIGKIGVVYYADGANNVTSNTVFFTEQTTTIWVQFGYINGKLVREKLIYLSLLNLANMTQDEIILPEAEFMRLKLQQQEAVRRRQKEELIRFKQQDIREAFNRQRNQMVYRLGPFELDWYRNLNQAKTAFNQMSAWHVGENERAEALAEAQSLYPLLEAYYGLSVDTIQLDDEADYLAEKQRQEAKLNAQIQMWERIKQKRDEVIRGGVYIQSVGKWFETDVESCVRYNGIMNAAGDAKGMWKCLDDTYIEYNKALISEVITHIAKRENTVFKVAEYHRMKMEKLENPLEYDFSEKWPAVFSR